MKTQCCAAWLLASCVLLSSATALASDRLRTIDAAYSAGDLTHEQWIVYRLAAVRDPSLLPDAFKNEATSSFSRCHSPIPIAARQALPRLSSQAASQVRNLLAPPADPPYSVEATDPFPVRVGYSDPALASNAERVLEGALFAYQKQVVEFGFHAPPIDPAHQAYRFYIGSAEGAAGFTSPYAPVVETPHSDSYSYIVIDTSLSGISLDTTVTHEFNHACQLSMDSEEVLTFFENTATYIEGQVYPSSLPYVSATFPYFQSQPHRPLEYMSLFDSDLYEYGGSLFTTFLAETYGQSDPRFIRELWEAAMQDGSTNEPDYFDAMAEKLEAEGGLPEAVKKFSESRFFVGQDDDGRHLQNASGWHGAGVKRAATWSLNQLPIVDKGSSSSATRPQPNGCNYIVLNTGQNPPPLHFTFSGAKELDWSVALVELGAPNSTLRHDVPVLLDGKGELDVEAADFEGLLAIVCQLGSASYDPDARAWLAGGYSYSFDYGFPSPVIDSVTPARIERGAHDVTLTIHGSGFADYEGLEIAVAPSDVKLWIDDVVSSEEIRVVAAVPPSAGLGPRDVIVTNPGGKTAVGVDLLTVVEPDDPENPEPPTDPRSEANPTSDVNSTDGCQVRAGHPAHARWLGLGLVALLAAGVGRRRRTRTVV